MHPSYFEEETLDDLLRAIFTQLLNQNGSIAASRGRFSEIFGAMLVLRNPRARLSRSESKGKIFSALGELFWYLSQKNDLAFIEYYLPKVRKESDDNVSIRSGYGERLYSHNGQNQIANVIDLLKKKKTSRRAVIQLFDATDLSQNFKSIPCTCTLQFLIRDEKLNLLVNMRSNDAYLGLPHDVFSFTMLQEIVARSVDAEMGTYKHSAGSLHLYEEDFELTKQYLKEGWQSPVPMPKMSSGDPWNAISIVRKVEEQVRAMETVDLSTSGLDEYWADLCRLLVVFQKSKLNRAGKLSKNEVSNDISALKSKMDCNAYNMFIDGRLDSTKE